MSNIVLGSNSTTGVPAELASMTTEQLRTELTRQMAVTAQSLLRLAWVVRALEERGEDLAELRISLLSYLRRIAHGQLLPEAVVRFAESPLLMQRVASLPLPDQEKLARGESVRLAVRAGDGQSWTHRLVDPIRLGREGVALVFDPKGRLRSEGEQILLLEARERQTTPETVRRQRVRGDPDKGQILIGRSRASTAEVLAALADLKPAGLGGEPTEKILVPLSPDEHRHLKVLAAQGDTTMSELVRRALRLAGLLGD